MVIQSDLSLSKGKLFKWLLERNKYAIDRSAITKQECNIWLPYFTDSEPDPYTELTVYKRSSWFALNPNGHVDLLPPSPMCQSSDYNKTDCADVDRKYLDVQQELIDDPSFQRHVQNFSNVHGLAPREPILAITIQTRIEPFSSVDIDGDGVITREEYEMVTKKKDFDKIDIDGSGTISMEEYEQATADADPLSGQGIHRDGNEALSVICISRENCKGGVSEFFEDHAGTRAVAAVSLDAGHCVHFKDLDLFHNVTRIQPIDKTKVTHRSIMILACRFQDDEWHNMLTKFYGPMNCQTVKGVGEMEKLFHLLDADGSGEIDLDEFRHAMTQITNEEDTEKLFGEFDSDGNGALSKMEFISGMEKVPIKAINHEEPHFW